MATDPQRSRTPHRPVDETCRPTRMDTRECSVANNSSKGAGREVSLTSVSHQMLRQEGRSRCDSMDADTQRVLALSLYQRRSDAVFAGSAFRVGTLRTAEAVEGRVVDPNSGSQTKAVLVAARIGSLVT